MLRRQPRPHTGGEHVIVAQRLWRFALCACAVLVPLILSRWVSAETGNPTIHVSDGVVAGQSWGKTGALFRGIPYAAPPVGDLRWRDPAPMHPWKGARDATHDGNACMQPMMGWNDSVARGASEDCLYLNIRTPSLNASAHLPVMLWIHGGGFVGGAATDAMFDGAHLGEQGVVLVEINYRLGVLGFLAHPDLSRESRHQSSGNYGLLDQLAALRWVKENIARFGGDPGNVTIFGQSAGGMSVMSLLASPLARGLIARAIIESGSMVTPLPRLKEAETGGSGFAGASSVDALRGLPAAELMSRWGQYAAARQADPGARLGVIVDGYVLKDDPAAVFAQHTELRVPLIVGNNSREALGPPHERDLAEAIRQFYGADAQAALAAYGVAGGSSSEPDPVLGPAANQFATDTTFRCGAVITARRHAAGGSPVYEYQFEEALPGREPAGAQHSFELPYVFGNLQTDGPLGGAFSDRERSLSELMVTYWTTFARTGDPNGSASVRWPRWTAESAGYLHFSTRLTHDAEAGSGLRAEPCHLFEQKLESGSLNKH
jgi:para-nitrobenzyl esterase